MTKLSKEAMREYQAKRRAAKKMSIGEKHEVTPEEQKFNRDNLLGGVLEAGPGCAPGGSDLVRAGSTPAPPVVKPTAEEWAYALERAERARRYAEMFPDIIRPSEVRFQDPVWQWENETKGRMPV